MFFILAMLLIGAFITFIGVGFADMHVYGTVLDTYIKTEAEAIAEKRGATEVGAVHKLEALNDWMARNHPIAKIAKTYGGAAYLYYIKRYGRE